jgi:hypothetical protein
VGCTKGQKTCHEKAYFSINPYNKSCFLKTLHGDVGREYIHETFYFDFFDIFKYMKNAFQTFKKKCISDKCNIYTQEQKSHSQPMLLEEFSLYTQSCKATNKNVKLKRQMQKQKLKT